jgi:opacity protein-like surface antigen
MKRLVVAGVIAAAFCGGPALAAKVLPPPAAAAFSWAGFYVGANGGYEWTDPKTSPIAATQSIPPLAGIGPLTFQADGIFPLTSSVGQSGAIGGLQAGYNWQANAFVAGIEADFDYSSAGRSTVTANHHHGNGYFAPARCFRHAACAPRLRRRPYAVLHDRRACVRREQACLCRGRDERGWQRWIGPWRLDGVASRLDHRRRP